MIELKHLGKIYSSASGSVEALKDVNLTIADGEIFGIIGLSGAGKSTLVRCTYRIANYPAGSDTIYADLLLWQEQVIGGDLRSASLDGFLTSLNGSEKS